MPELLSSTEIQTIIQASGLWVLFVLVMLESAGVPLPGETSLIAAALYAGSTGQISIAEVVLTAGAAAILGDNLGYLIGRTVGLPLLERYGRFVRLDAARLKIGQYLFQRHGGKIVFFGRFIAFLRAFAAVLAGTNRMPWRRFLALNALGGMSWASLIGGGAYLFGESIRHVAGPASLILLVLATGLVLAGLVHLSRHERDLEERARAALPDPPWDQPPS